MADTYKVYQPFLPLNSTVLFGHFVAVKCPHRTPQILAWYLVSNPTADYRTYIAKQYPLHPVIFCTPAFTTVDGRKNTRPKISRFDRGEWGGYLKTPPHFNITNTHKTYRKTPVFCWCCKAVYRGKVS